MKNVYIKAKPNFLFKKKYQEIFLSIEYIKFLKLLNIDFGKMIDLVVVEFKLTKEIKIPKVMYVPIKFEMLEFLKTTAKKNICLIKISYNETNIKLLKNLKLNLKWRKPTIFTKDSIEISCVGEEKDINSFLKYLKFITKIEIKKDLSTKKNEYDLISDLNKEEKSVFLYAKKNGFYQRPKKISIKKIAKSFKISEMNVKEIFNNINKKILKNSIDK
jgi:predicted DNA binding protein